LANLEIFKQERTLERLAPKIAVLCKLLTPLWSHPHVGDIRQIGFIAGIELVRDRMTKESYSLAERMGTQVTEVARAAGLLLRPLGNIIVLMPPLSTTATELRAMVRIVSQAITTVTKV